MDETHVLFTLKPVVISGNFRYRRAWCICGRKDDESSETDWICGSGYRWSDWFQGGVSIVPRQLRYAAGGLRLTSINTAS